MEVGSLSIPVTADLGPLQKQLEALKRQLGNVEGQTSGVTNAMRGVERQTKSLGGVVSTFAKQLAGVFAVRELINFADTWSDISSRVGIAVGDMDKVPAVMERIAATARMTYSNLNLTAEGFIQNSTVLKELGKSTQQQLDYQEALNNALVVSGAKGRQAQFVQESLNRSMALGAMRGIELNNVLNYGGRIAELLGEHFNTTTGGLMKLAREGKITAAVINDVLTKNMVTLREEAESMPATIGDAFTLIGNALLQTIGVFDQAGNISETLAGALILVADNMQRVISYVATGAAGWGAYQLAIIAVNAGLFTTVGALTAVRVALQRLLFATVIGGLIVVIGELLNKLWEARQASESWGEAFQQVGKRLVLLFDGVLWSFRALADGMQSVWAGAMADILRTTRDNFGAILALFGVSIDGIDASISRLMHKAEDMGGAAKSSATIAMEQFKQAFAAFDVGEGADLSGDGGPNRVVADPGKQKKTKAQRDAERLREAYADLIRDSKAFIAQQEMERQAIGMTDLEAAKLRATFDLLNQAQRAGIVLTDAQTEELTNLAHQMAEAEVATDKLREAYEFNKDVFKGFFGDLKSELQNGASIWEAFGTAASNALQKIADKALDMALNGIFDMIFGAFGGGGTTSFLGGILGGSRVGLFANGTSFAPGGWSVVGERGPELMKLPAGTQVQSNNRVTAPAQATFGGGSGGNAARGDINIYVSGARGNAEIREMVGEGVSDALQYYDANQLPDSVQRVSNHPRMR